MAQIEFLLYVILYLATAFLCIKLIKKLFQKNNALNTILLSICYAIFFGIGIWGSGGGEPGFALPVPIFGAAILYVKEWSPWNQFINGVIFPFIFWWILILVVMIIRNKIKKLFYSKKVSNN